VHGLTAAAFYGWRSGGLAHRLDWRPAVRGLGVRFGAEARVWTAAAGIALWQLGIFGVGVDPRSVWGLAPGPAWVAPLAIGWWTVQVGLLVADPLTIAPRAWRRVRGDQHSQEVDSSNVSP
jgi:hypothetical protein